jgi:hypothetical protein
LKNKPSQFFFRSLFSRANLIGVTHEGIMPFALARLA